ncbi:MAG: trigger factor [Oscillospiraceae bacterium]|nr:trigger factor [Oscillospiraceae bacterium]
MKLLSTEKKETNEVELIVEVEPEELESAVNKVYIKNRNRISVPGFRKGKAPRKIIERMYGAEIFLSDALEDMFPDVLDFSIKETEYDVVGFPKVSDVDVKDNNTRVEITLIAALYPDVVIGKYKGLSAPKPTVEVLENEIDNEVATVRTRNARIEKADRAAKDGDITIIDFEGFVDGVAFEGGKGENYELELGSDKFITGFEEKVEGMSVGEERDINLVFPEQYKEDLAGKPVVFKVKLNEVKEKLLPELDDEFAKDVSEFDTLDEYKADIKDKMLKTRQQDVDETFEGMLLDKLIESLEADVPDAMIEEQLDKSMDNLTRQISAYGMQPAQYMQMMGLSPVEFKEKMRDSSEKQVKITLALTKISELENIKISDADVDKECEEAAERYGMELDKFNETVSRENVMRDLKLREAVKIVVDNAVIEEFKEEDTKEEDKKEPTAKKTAKSEKQPAAAKKEASSKKAAPSKKSLTKKEEANKSSVEEK